MKYRLLLFYLLLSSLLANSVFAQNEISFDDSGYKAVLERSKKEHKPIFYMLYATWCAHCNKMKEEVFKDTLVTHFMNKNFVNARQDAEKGAGDYFKKRFGIQFYPTFIIMDENGIELNYFSGEFTSDKFITEAENALKPELQLPYLENQFKADVRNADKCLAYITALNRGRKRSYISPIAHEYLATQSEDNLVSAINWKIIANAVTDIKSREFQYVLQHQKEFEAVASAKRVSRKIENIVTELLNPYVEMKDTLGYSKNRMLANSIQTRKIDSLLYRYDLELAEKTNNWKQYKTVSIASTDKYSLSDSKLLLDIGGNYLKYIADLASLNYAILWTQKALSLNETYSGQIQLAKLFQKTKNYKEALFWADKAKTKNIALGWKTKEADDLLLELDKK